MIALTPSEHAACVFGLVVALAGAAGVVAADDPDTPKALFAERSVVGVAFDPTGTRLAVATPHGDRPLIILDTKTGQATDAVIAGARPFLCVDFAPDGCRVAAGELDGTVTVYDTKKGEVVARLKGPGHQVSQVRFSPDGERLAVTILNHLSAWSAPAGKEPKHLVTLRFEETEFTARLKLKPNEPCVDVKPRTTGLVSFDWARDGDSLLVSAGEASLRAFKVPSGEEGAAIRTGLKGTVGVRVWGGNTAVGESTGVDADVSGSIHILRAKDDPLTIEKSHKGGAGMLRFSGDGATLVSAGEKEIKVWDVKTGRLKATIPRPVTLACVAVSADGSLVAGGGTGGRGLFLWKADTGKPLVLEIKEN
ncbi:MAG: WD40 repeat domain-containing protein [Gemmataceae bacterium]|nr:WD40 repeat domain-containing protein [Gemmataceae bacterium]